MNRSGNGRRRDLEQTFPGCMGKTINVFDLGAGMAGNKLHSDKAHREGSPVRRNRSDGVKKPIDPDRVHLDDRPITTNDVRKSSPSKKSSATPMKNLIAQEMLKETGARRKQPSIVARLMGLDDAMPVQQPALAAKRNLKEDCPRSKSTGALRGRRHPEDVYFDRPRAREIHTCSREREYRDVYAVCQQSSKTNHTRDHAPPKERFNEDQNKKRMDLVRQKFIEAKRLATDEKLLQSKEFQDALEVLSSNRDLFLKFLEEPNSLFSKHSKELHAIPPPSQTKRITVLKPSKTVEAKGEKHVEKQEYPSSSGNEWEIDKPRRVSNFSRPKVENLSQPTRIVVLKPSPAKICDMKSTTTTPISSPELPQHTDFYRSYETSEAVGSREIAKEITRQMQESVGNHRRDESLLSSVLSNGYVGDDSSFDKSENEYIEDDAGNFSDSEIMTPTSRNSWDYNNRIGSPCSLSSFSRASYSPESSVVREAKKRLSERWALVASNGISRDHMQVWRGSSTLGEMLAISEVKKKEIGNRVFNVSSSKSCGGEEELRATTAGLSIGRTKDLDSGKSSPISLSRSQSVPVSSSAYENIDLSKEASGSKSNNSIAPEEATKPKSGKSSFKGKVSNFFSRNKKSGKQKTVLSPLSSSGDRIHSSSPESVLKDSDTLTESFYDSSREESLLVNPEEQSSKASFPALGNVGSRKGVFSSKVAISLEKPKLSDNMSKNEGKLGPTGNSSENQDQPSPTSVLDALFEDDAHSNASPSSGIVNAGPPQALSRSAPIESVARSLSWDDTRSEITSSPNPLRLSREDEQEVEQNWSVFIEDLLSFAGFDNERVDTIFAGWHSHESPLDPTVQFKILNQKEEGGRSREKRSSQRLLFDCVNAALLGIGHTTLLNAYPWAREFGEARKNVPAGTLVVEEVSSLVRGWLSQVSSEADNNTLVVDRLVRNEVAGKGWTAELIWTEIDEVCQEIGGEVLDELVREALCE